MKACNVYIISLDDELQHRIIVSEILTAIKALACDAGEAYIPHMFFVDEPNAENLLGIINGSKYGRPDIIVSVGLSITLGLAELYKTIDPISTLFVGIYDPVAYELVNSLEKPGGWMTGVRWEIPDSHDFIRQTFKPLVPAMKKIFMPYDLRLDQLNYSIEKVVIDVAKVFEELGCEVMLQAVDSKEALIEAVKDHLQSCHAIVDFGLHFDTVQDVSYICGIAKRIFISQHGEFGFDNGASVVVMPEDSMLLCKAISKQIKSFWWHRKALAGQAVISLNEEYVHVCINSFMLPYWAFDLLLPLLNSFGGIVFKNCWVRSPIQLFINKKT